MLIATYNINGVNKRLGNLLDWLAERAPDVVCLQELKATEAQFPRAALADAGYDAIWCGQSAWNGAAILSRGPLMVPTCRSLPGDAADRQARYVEAAVAGAIVASIYAPNGNPQPGPKFDYKLAWHDRLNVRAGELLGTGAPVVLAGDYNVVPTNADIYPGTSYTDNALVQPQSREAFARLLDLGYTDALRHLHPDDAELYTFWGYLRQRWKRNAGMRLDHFLLNDAALARLKDARIDRHVRGAQGASDHVPVWIELA